MNKLLKNTMIFAVSNFASKFLVFLLLPFYTRVLSPAELGIGDLIISSISLLLPIFTLSFSDGALRYAKQQGINREEVFTIGIKVILFGFIVLLASYPLLMKINIINSYIILCYLIYITSTLNNYFNQFIRGIGNIKLIGIVGVISTLVFIVFNILFLAVWDLGIHGYLISYLLMTAIGMLIFFFNAKLYKYFSFKSKNSELFKEMLRYNVPMIPNRVSWWIIMLSNRYFINFFHGALQVGVFTAAYRIPSIIITIYGVVQQALLLSVIDDFEGDNDYKTFKNVYKFMNIILIFSVLILNTSIRPIADLLFGSEYLNAWKIAPLLVISVLFGSLHGNLTTIFSAIKKTKILFWNSSLGAIINIILNILLVPSLMLYGSAIASIVTYFVVWLHLLHKSAKYIKNYNRLKTDFLCYFLLILHSGIIISMSSAISYLLTIIIFAVIILFKYEEVLFSTKMIGKLLRTLLIRKKMVKL